MCHLRTTVKVALTICFGVALSARAAEAQTLTTLYSFTGQRGADPRAGFIADAAGNLYSTTYEGGTNGMGTVFELSPPAAGQTEWTNQILFAFDGKHGEYPRAGLIADAAGNLYGTTQAGGTNGDGVAFELSPPPVGQTRWVEKVLFAFGQAKGAFPLAGLIADPAGNLYGTANLGGRFGVGTAFALSPPTGGRTRWTETVLFSFDGGKGAYPTAGFIADGAGNLYGTTATGGANGDGTVFALLHPVEGQTQWRQQVLLSFDGRNGLLPQGGLIADAAGNLYGTTEGGGRYGGGTVFELVHPQAGQTQWKHQLLVSIRGPSNLGSVAGLIADHTGNLYGTTYGGGALDDGSVFEVSPPATGDGAWTIKTLASLFYDSSGSVVAAGLLADTAGNLYGTAATGSAHRAGAVFKISP